MTAFNNEPFSKFEDLDKALKEEYEDEFNQDHNQDQRPPRPSTAHVLQHRIALTVPETQSIVGKTIPVPQKYHEALKAFLNPEMSAGRLQRARDSNVASGMFLKPRKDPSREPRVLGDYTKLNAVTVKDHTPLPLHQTILDAAQRAQVRGNIDLKDAYYQTPMHPEDVRKTASAHPLALGCTNETSCGKA